MPDRFRHGPRFELRERVENAVDVNLLRTFNGFNVQPSLRDGLSQLANMDSKDLVGARQIEYRANLCIFPPFGLGFKWLTERILSWRTIHGKKVADKGIVKFSGENILVYIFLP